MDKKCPNCGDTGNVDRNLNCHSCGVKLKIDPESGEYAIDFVPCRGCGQLNLSNVNFCSKCGGTIKDDGPLSILPESKEAKSSFNKLGKKFVAIGIALLAGISLTWALYAFRDKGLATGPKIDVVFCIDTTGSMGDEIEVIKTELKNMIKDIQKGNPRPQVRIGVVAYKDRGDEYVVKIDKLTDNISDIENIINSLKAQGGGDHEESINEALHGAVEEINWDNSKGVSKMIFLIGDAGPHMDYENDYNYKKEIDIARARNISITTIGCSGMDKIGNSVFQEIASNTNGNFEHLTYRQAYVNDEGKEEVVLYQGGKTYVVNEACKKDSTWKDDGAINFASREKAVIMTGSDAPSISGGAAPGEFKDKGKSYKPSQKLENNLDRVVEQKVQKEAEKQGVSY